MFAVKNCRRHRYYPFGFVAVPLSHHPQTQPRLYLTQFVVWYGQLNCWPSRFDCFSINGMGCVGQPVVNSDLPWAHNQQIPHCLRAECICVATTDRPNIILFALQLYAFHSTALSGYTHLIFRQFFILCSQFAAGFMLYSLLLLPLFVRLLDIHMCRFNSPHTARNCC